MPMFEDNLDLVQDGERLQKEPSPPRPSPPADLAGTPSKPIYIPAPSIPPYHSRRMSEESIRTELCEGPLSNTPSPLPRSFTARSSPASAELHIPSHQPPPRTPPSRESSVPITDRAELIERIKRGESPTWVPNRHLESLFHIQSPRSPTRSPRPLSAGTPTVTTLLPAADISPERIPLEAHDHGAESSARLEDGINIERPRSALHSGDFTESTSSRHHGRSTDETKVKSTGALGVGATRADIPIPPFRADTNASWAATSPPRHYTPLSLEHRSMPASSLAEIGVFRSGVPSPSSSLSSSFVYMPPTSPLVQSYSNDDDGATDITLPMNNIDIALGSSPTSRASNVRASSRRHTLTFASHAHFHHSQSSPYPVAFPSHSLSRQTPGSIRRDSPFPYQAHQPRRSLSSTSNHNAESSPSFYAASTPHTPLFSRSRRPSFTLDTSPLQHASMVGSYEESILRGRMSTTPSKPLDFLAQIGVLGLGTKCKPSLRCPAHVTLPFSAVFYSYATTSYGRSKAEDGPSPYVGMVDLENGLPNSGAEQRSKRKAMMSSRRAASSTRAPPNSDPRTGNPSPDEIQTPLHPDEGIPPGEDVVMEDMHVDRLGLSDSEVPNPATSASRSHKRRPHGLKAPPGGSYRIPQQGQLQIIIKNQNKTAVKLFLIPYDLTGMEPGTKTFVRQRSYSAGPIIDNMPTSSDPSSERPILRYLIHIHICCPSRGRYYLYRSIRVVFANRVPDGKEKLRNELTFPEPRYSPYKPIRAMHPPVGMAGNSGYHLGGGAPRAGLASEKAYRRRSSGFSFSTHGVSEAFDTFGIQEPLASPAPLRPTSPKHSVPWRSNHGPIGISSFSHIGSNTPIDPLPLASAESPMSSSTGQFPSQTSSSYTATTDLKRVIDRSPGSENGKSEGGNSVQSAVVALPIPALYKKLSKGDIGYGGNAFLSGSPAVCEGLLSQRLRSLEAERNSPPE